VVVVPVKDAAEGKTRLSAALDDLSRAALARAMALDTIAAAAACPAVGAVVVVTSDEVVARDAAEAGRTAVLQRPGAHDEVPAARLAPAAVVLAPEPSHDGARSGLDAAAAAGVARARALAPSAPVGVLLGDLPALLPGDLAVALADAERHRRALVADSSGAGTTLLTISDGAPLDSRFGLGSAAAHAALGYVPLDVDPASTLRRDIDLPADLDALRELRPGPRTARLLDRLFVVDRRSSSASATEGATALGEQPPRSATRRL
jgi:2-phospho-L-lactate guanylyltransferase